MHSVAEFTHEAIEGVTHADSRLWKTLWLLIAKPGVLTLEFIEGRRARYLPPFRLYLVLSVLMFLIIALVTPHGAEVIAEGPPAVKQQGERELVPTNETPEQRAQRICDGGHIGVVSDEWEKRLLLSCRKVVVDNGHAFAQALLHNIPRALFVLIPLIALIMSAMYWKRYYVEHLLFLIHNHAFTFVLYAVLILATAITPWGWVKGFFVTVMVIYPAIYSYKAMRLVYGQQRWMRRLKFATLAFAYGLLFLMIASFTAFYSMVTL